MSKQKKFVPDPRPLAQTGGKHVMFKGGVLTLEQYNKIPLAERKAEIEAKLKAKKGAKS